MAARLSRPHSSLPRSDGAQFLGPFVSYAELSHRIIHFLGKAMGCTATSVGLWTQRPSWSRGSGVAYLAMVDRLYSFLRLCTGDLWDVAEVLVDEPGAVGDNGS